MSAKPIVLVIEGMPSEGETLPRVLESPHYHTVFVESPEDAMAHVESPIDLVLSGVSIGDSRGRELLDRWKARRPETPFILMTTAANVATARQGVEMGAAGYIAMPATASEISSQISKWLSRPRQPEQPHTNNGSAIQSNGAASRQDLSAIRIPPGTTLEQLERVAVEQSLEQHHGNRTHAAKELGISVRTLQRKLKAWGEMRGHAGEPVSMREPTMKSEQSPRPWNTSPVAPRQVIPARPRLASVNG